jgi:hypothetical protein
MDSEIESDVDVEVDKRKKKTKKSDRDDAGDDGYVRPDKCEFCGISFLGTTASQWNRRNIEVHKNSKTCQNNLKKSLKMSGGGAAADGGESTGSKTPKTPKGIQEKQYPKRIVICVLNLEFFINLKKKKRKAA